MAIIEESVNHPQDQQPKAEAKEVKTGGFSFHSNSLFAAPIGVGVGSEYYTQVKNGLLEIYKTANTDVEIALIDMDRDNMVELAYSAIVVALRLKKQPQLGVAYHIILLEKTGEKLTPIYDTVSGQQVEVLRVTSDALDEVLASKAKEKVSRAFPNVPNFMVDGVVVPSTFDPQNKYSMHQLALNAGLANGTELELHSPSFEDLNLAKLVHDSSMEINIAFNKGQMENAVGQPMRSDILVNFVSKKQSQNQRRSVNAGDREAKVAEVSGFIDLVWNPANPMAAFNPYAPVQNTQTQKYAARAVITNLASNYAYTPGSVLLALATSLSLRDDSNWIQAFRPMPVSGNEIDLSDIGALNIEANLLNDPSGFGTRIDTKSDSFHLEDLGQLVAALIQPGLIMSLDCPEVGPQSWYLSVFAAASNGSQAAYKMIYNAAMELTNGNFGKYFPNGGGMFVDMNNRVHLGTWVDRNGNTRDIRDIDYVAVANLVGERNPQLLRDWSDTFLRTNYPLAQRLAARKKMISGLTNETATFTGFAQRVTFSAAFMDALSKGIKETGLPVRVNTPLSSSEFSNQRGIATFASSALMAPGQSFVQAPSFGYQPQYGSFNNYGSMRW